MIKKLGLQIDHPSSLNYSSDSSVLIAKYASSKNFEVWTYQPSDLFFKDGKVWVKAHLTAFTNEPPFYNFIFSEVIKLEDFEIILIRQDPPFNFEYLTACYLMKSVKHTKIFNSPDFLISNPEKIIPLYFSYLMPKTLITDNLQLLEEFITRERKVILKPLYSYAGKGINLITPSDFHLLPDLIVNYKTSYGNLPVIAQKYLPSVMEDGDVRVIMSFDKIITCFKRIPEGGKVIANLAQGGTAHKHILTTSQLEICNEIGKFLKKNNCLFAGIDLIEDNLIEVNVTSPTGLITANSLYNQKFEEIIFSGLFS
ncbi:MAG: hypothetical protein J0H68_07230 [Sphingobacteriia bacterium]|nr:hypothetical protein [Sphingobacteriia bacterium]